MKIEQKEKDRYLKLLAKSSFFVFISIALSKIFSYGYKVVIARTMGVEIYGLFSLALILIGLFVTFTSLGLIDGLLRYIPYYRGKKELKKVKFLIRICFVVLLITSILSSILLFVLSEVISIHIFKEPGLIYYLKILSWVVPFAVISSMFLTIIRAFEKITAYSFLMNIFQNGLKFFLLVIFILIGLKTNALIFSYLFAFIGLFLVGYFFARTHIKKVFKEKDLKSNEKRVIFRELFLYSWPLIFVGILYSLFYWTDSLMLGYFKTATEVGLYNATITIVSLFSIAPNLFAQLFIPLVSKKLSQNKSALIKQLTQQITKWIYLLNLPIFAMLFLFPGVVINFLFGSEFIIAQTSLRILSLGGLFAGFTSILIGLITVKGDTKTILKDFIVFLVINIILNILLIPKYGINGAAIATTIAWILFTIIPFVQVKTKLHFFALRKVIIKITLIMLLPLLILLLISKIIIPTMSNLILTGLIFLLSYFALLITTRCLDKNDLMVIKSITSKIRGITKLDFY
jgi:O-antigen/teichoic acid export membrane protein